MCNLSGPGVQFASWPFCAFPRIWALAADLIAGDFLEGSVDVEQGHVVSLAGGELPARGEHLVAAGRRVVQHRVRREQRHDGQHLLRAREVWGQQDGLNRTQTQGQGRVEAKSVAVRGLNLSGFDDSLRFRFLGLGLESMLILNSKLF